MNYMPEMLNERKVKIAIAAVLNAMADADGDEAEGIRAVIDAMRKDRDIADGLAMVAYRHVAEQTSDDRDGVGVGHSRNAHEASMDLPTSTPTNSGAEGHGTIASDGGPRRSAPAPLPERGEEGLVVHAIAAGQPLPSSPLPLSKNTGGAGLSVRAPERQQVAARPPVPHSAKHLSVVERTRNSIATGILAKHKLHDGRVYTDLYARELPFYQTKAEPMAIQHLIIKTIRRDYPTIDPNKRLGEEGSNTLSRISLENIIKHAEEVIRAVE